MYALKIYRGSWDKHSYAMFVGGKVVYYTGGVPPPSNQRKNRRAGPTVLFSATPQVLIGAYISAVITSINMLHHNRKGPGGAGSARRGLAKNRGSLTTEPTVWI